MVCQMQNLYNKTIYWLLSKICAVKISSESWWQPLWRQGGLSGQSFGWTLQQQSQSQIVLNCQKPYSTPRSFHQWPGETSCFNQTATFCILLDSKNTTPILPVPPLIWNFLYSQRQWSHNSMGPYQEITTWVRNTWLQVHQFSPSQAQEYSVFSPLLKPSTDTTLPVGKLWAVFLQSA